MLYKEEITTPINTARTSPMRTELELAVGVVSRVSLSFPAGCAGLVGLRVLDGLLQLWPLTPGEWFIADDFTIDFPENRFLTNGAKTYTVESFNEDTRYEHTVSLQVHVAEPSVDPTAQVRQILEALESAAADSNQVVLPALTLAMTNIAELLYLIHIQDLQAIAQLLQARQ
jgi:hypothetical protein